jgi:MFS family permease
MAAASLSALSIICTSTLLPKAEPHKAEADGGPGGRRLGVLDGKGYLQYFARPDLGPLLWQFFFFAFSFALFISGYALFAERRVHMGPREVGYVLAWVGFLGIILQGGLMGKLVKRLGERTLIWTGFLVSATSDAWLAWARSVPELLGNATYGAYGGVVRPSVTALISRQAGRREQGVVLGLTQSITSVCQIVGPIIAGALIDRRLLAAWALLTASVALGGMVAALRFRPVAAETPVAG